jgi:hypothetical protein
MYKSTSITWIQLTVTSLIIMLGWFIAHLLTSRRDAANRRREIQVAALRSLYMKLANANRREPNEQIPNDIESLVSEIQLYGDKRLTDLTAKLVEDYKSAAWVSYDALLRELRDQIREDLSLPKLHNEVWWLRFPSKPKTRTVNDPPSPPSSGPAG